MPAPSKIAQLPEDLRTELEDLIIHNGFGGYVQLAEWLQAKGYAIGKTTVGKHGRELERRLARIRTSTEAARMITAVAPDDADERSNAIISLVQTEIFESLMALQEAEEEDDPTKRIALLGDAAKNIATLTRASVTRNKWAQEVRAKVLLETANRVEDAALERGLTADDAKFWREQVLMGM